MNIINNKSFNLHDILLNNENMDMKITLIKVPANRNSQVSNFGRK